MGERNSPDAGETTLAAATAAIITARWAASAPPGRRAAPADGHPANGYPEDGHSHPGNGHPGNGHPGNGHPGNGHLGNGHPGNGFGGGLPEWRPEPTFDGGLPPTSPAPFVSAPSPEAPPSPVSPAPYLQSQGSGLAAAATYFSAVAPDPVPEVFDGRSQESGLPSREPGRDLGPARGEVRTQVPPGFERRTFSPMPTEPEQPGGGWTVPDQRSGARVEEPRSDSVPSALLGVLPSPAQPIPASFAPPEPAPWVDSGWVDFPRDVEPEPSALVGAGMAASSVASGRAALPRRTPRVPDMDYPLFEDDPADPAPDPATQRQELNRIADFLRVDDTSGAGSRPDAIDLEAVLGAIRAVPDVKDAQLRWNAQAGHTLRIEFADGVDESEVTRSVVRLLRANLGLAAQPSSEEPTVDSPFRGRVSVGAARAARPGAGAAPGGRPLPRPSGVDTPRLVLENVAVTRLGAEATIEVRLRAPGGAAVVGEGRGPGVDAYLSRLAATAAAHAIDKALSTTGAPRGKVFVEHVSVVPFGVVEVAVVVLLLAYDGSTEQLSGSAVVGDDPHVAVVRATLAALNRRLESLLA